MKNESKKAICALLVFAVLISVISVSAWAQTPADLSGENWMSAIPDDRYIYEINIPGTHDSAAAYCKNSTGNSVLLFGMPVYDSGKFAKTQSLTLPEQLDAGVRYLDLRFSPQNEQLLLCHGNNEKVSAVNKAIRILSFLNPVTLLLDRMNRPILTLDTEFYAYEDAECAVNLTCGGVMTRIKDFLRENPTETIIVTAKKENGDTQEFLKLFGEQLEALKTEINPSTGEAYLYTENGAGVYTRMPALSEVRGKIILMTPFYEELSLGDTLDAKNGAGQTDFMGMTFDYENHWSVFACLKTHYVKKFAKEHSTDMSPDASEHLTVANVLKTNSSAVGLQTPYKIAGVVNESLYGGDGLIKGRYYGWIMGDFMTADICREIWQTNYFESEPAQKAAQ